MENKKLINEAKKAMEKAYAPYSKFKVGAALLTEDLNIYTGCNVENASYGATICAERSAILAAINAGEKEFIKIAVVSSEATYTYPCGICRQFLSEFTKKCKVIMEDKDKGIREIDFVDIFPDAFSLK